MATISWRVSTAGSPHAVILGMSGQGKSRTMKKIHREFVQHGAAVVLDFHGDLSESMADYSKVVNVAKEGLPFNPFMPPSSEVQVVKQFCLDFGDILQAVCGLGDIQKVQVYRALLASFESSGYIDSNSSVVPNMKDFVSQLNIQEQSNKRVSASARIIGITEFELFSESSNLRFEDLDSSIVIDLSGLGSEELKRVCASFVLRKIYSVMHSRGQKQRIDYGVFIDEAHLMAKEVTISRLFKEARKFGIGVILASQSIGDFNEDVKDNAGLKMVFRMNSPSSSAAARFIGGADVKSMMESIEKLKVGQCLTQLSSDDEVRKVQVFE